MFKYIKRKTVIIVGGVGLILTLIIAAFSLSSIHPSVLADSTRIDRSLFPNKPYQQNAPVAQNLSSFEPIFSPSPKLTPTCIPKPPCLDTIHRCLITEPAGGWCPIASIHPLPSPTAAYTTLPKITTINPTVVSLPTAAATPIRSSELPPTTFPQSTPDTFSSTPQPLTTCIPKPACLSSTPRCMIPQQMSGYCN